MPTIFIQYKIKLKKKDTSWEQLMERDSDVGEGENYGRGKGLVPDIIQ